MNTFIQEGCVKWIKSHSKDYIVRKDLHFEQMLLFFNFVFIKESKKKVSHVPKNNMKQHNSFNTDNKSAFLKDHVTLKTGVMMPKIQHCVTEILKYFQIRNQY